MVERRPKEFEIPTDVTDGTAIIREHVEELPSVLCNILNSVGCKAKNQKTDQVSLHRW